MAHLQFQPNPMKMLITGRNKLPYTLFLPFSLIHTHTKVFMPPLLFSSHGMVGMQRAPLTTRCAGYTMPHIQTTKYKVQLWVKQEGRQCNIIPLNLTGLGDVQMHSSCLMDQQLKGAIASNLLVHISSCNTSRQMCVQHCSDNTKQCNLATHHQFLEEHL